VAKSPPQAQGFRRVDGGAWVTTREHCLQFKASRTAESHKTMDLGTRTEELKSLKLALLPFALQLDEFEARLKAGGQRQRRLI